MTLAALLLSASTSAYADNNDLVYGDAYGTDDSSFVGDIASEDAYYGDEYVAPVTATQPVGQAYAPAQHYAPAMNRSSSRLSADALQPASYQLGSIASRLGGGSACDAMGCDGGCDGGCDSACGSGRRGGGLANALGMCDSDGWMRAGALLWFVQDRQTVPLVTTAEGGFFPVLGPAGQNTVVAFGNELEGGLSGGFRTDVGRYVSDGLGIGGRFWWLGDNGSDYANAADGSAGSQSIGRPFFDTNLGGESALEIAQPNLFSGSVNASESLDMWGAEAYARLRFCGSKTSHLEMIGGYSHFEIDSDLSINSTTLTLTGPTAGRIRTFSDQFNVENEFNGGQLGFESLIRRGRWTATALTKVHLGNMNARGRATGQFTDTNGPDNADSGFLVQADSNGGTYSTDEFTFIPEMNFQLGYRFRTHVDFNVGYSFLYFEKLGLAGSQIDRLIDSSEVGTDGTALTHPVPLFAQDSLFVHGLDLGVTVTY